MPAPKINSGSSLDVIREEIVFTIASCKADENAAGVASPLIDLRTEWESVHAAQLALWDAQVEADAVVVQADRALDELVDQFSSALLKVVGQNRKDPRYKLYFKKTPAELKRPILKGELTTVDAWLPKLETETDADLVPFFATISAAVSVGKKAEKQSAKADAANEAFRKTGGLATYTQKVEGGRDVVYAALDKIHNDLNLDRGYADSFFRHKKAAPPSDADKAAKAAKTAAKQAQKEAEAQAKANLEAAKKALRAVTKKK